MAHGTPRGPAETEWFVLFPSLSQSDRVLRSLHREAIGELRTERREATGELRKDPGALGERVARLEGLPEGLRDAVTGKAA